MVPLRPLLWSLVGWCSAPALAQTNLHFTYLWHLEQPIYWPDRQASGADRYERAWESIQHRSAGAAHPTNDLGSIFGLADRVNAYQWRCRDSIGAFSAGRAEAGAQISYSGGLIENIMSLGGASQLGYTPAWYGALREARGWTTFSGAAVPRCDLVIFPFHHSLMPLLDESAMRKEIQLYKAIYADAWGAGQPMSAGFFPSEMAFSTRMIPVLASEGIQWSIVSAEKISRACTDFPVVYGSGGINCDPPNRADQINPAQGLYYRKSISRGCAPTEAYPYAYTPHRARYVDPTGGAVSSIIVVPSAQHLSWEDGYSPQGIDDFNALNVHNDPSRPMLLVLAHDGDNAWGGGYSYYLEATPNRVAQAAGAGYVPTVVQRYLADHVVPAGDLVHVEDGAWVNADGDFGSPQFLNWNWPLVNSSGQVDISNGWAEDERNWAVITAAQNHVDTAEQIWKDPVVQGGSGGTVNIQKILYPDASTNNAERAWHYFLGALNSGYMYYGTAEDFEVKPTVACNEAVRLADPVIGTGSADRTPPTIWIPQRYPWNPGSTNFGPLHSYQQVVNNGDFWIWTFAHDVSGIAGVTLKYRVDADGQRSLGNTENETYAGGAGVGAWQSQAMARRTFPTGNVLNSGSIDFFELPQHIADQYSAQVVGLRDTLIDYYVEGTDTRGNVRRSPIQHVYIGTGQGSSGGGATVVTTPSVPTGGQSVTVTYDPAGRVLAGAASVTMHWGVNTWTDVTDTPMAAGSGASAGKWVSTITLPGNASQFDCVFNNNAGTWDNNSGQDWHFAVIPGTPVPTWTIDGTRDADAPLRGANGGQSLYAGVKGDVLYVCTDKASGGNDRFVMVAIDPGPGALGASPWGKAGQVAGWTCFLGNESTNNWCGWTDQATAAVQQSSISALEGTVNLRQLHGGTLPRAVWLAVASYPTADGTSLVPSLQVPSSINANTTLDAAEYLHLMLCGLTAAGCCPADVDDGTGSGTRDGGIDINDLLFFMGAYEAGNLAADLDDGSGASVPDGGVDINDLLFFLGHYESGC